MALSLSRPLPTLCINLDRDVDRMAATRAAFGDLPDFAIERLPGVLGSALPQILLPLLTKSRRCHPGTVGCFLSHVVAWERVAAGDQPMLIIEDDSRPVGLERVFDMEIPADAELVFVNTRMADAHDDTATPRIRSTRSILSVKANKKPGAASVGSYGYLLFPEGARKMLAAVARDGTAGHVDWRLFRYGLKAADVEALPGDPWFVNRNVLRTQGASWDVVTAYRLSQALITFVATRSARRFGEAG